MAITPGFTPSVPHPKKPSGAAWVATRFLAAFSAAGLVVIAIVALLLQQVNAADTKHAARARITSLQGDINSRDAHIATLEQKNGQLILTNNFLETVLRSHGVTDIVVPVPGGTTNNNTTVVPAPSPTSTKTVTVVPSARPTKAPTTRPIPAPTSAPTTQPTSSAACSVVLNNRCIIP